ncbi:MAG: ComF family protein, partial [Gammaproteobacteria bacterium]|nr:ComF family protein [Gammaproteobacteria bacterium]
MLCGGQADSDVQHDQDICPACLDSLPQLDNPCPVCALPVTSGPDLICGQCLQQAPPYQQTFSAYQYAPPLIQLVTGLKFHQRLAVARLFGQLLAQHLEQREFDRPECLIPVPLHPKRLRERGFNQSIEIARPISKQFDLPIDSELCQRLRHTTPQTGLN